MSFVKKTWLPRLGLGLNKFKFGQDGMVKELINVPDQITQQGDALTATNLNDLEDRIKVGFDDVPYTYVIDSQDKWNDFLASSDGNDYTNTALLIDVQLTASYNLTNNCRYFNGFGHLISAQTTHKLTWTSLERPIFIKNVRYQNVTFSRGSKHYVNGIIQTGGQIIYGSFTNFGTTKTPVGRIPMASGYNFFDYDYLDFIFCMATSGSNAQHLSKHALITRALFVRMTELGDLTDGVLELQGDGLTAAYQAGINGRHYDSVGQIALIDGTEMYLPYNEGTGIKLMAIVGY